MVLKGICCVANFDPNYNTMVLKEATMYTLLNNSTNNRNTGLIFWHNVGAYKGHLWCEFQHSFALIVEVIDDYRCLKHFA